MLQLVRRRYFAIYVERELEAGAARKLMRSHLYRLAETAGGRGQEPSDRRPQCIEGVGRCGRDIRQRALPGILLRQTFALAEDECQLLSDGVVELAR